MMIESVLTLPLLLKAAPVLIPVTAKLAKHLFTADNKLLSDLIELAIDEGEDATEEKLEAALKQKPDVVLSWHAHVFIDYTGWVLGQLVQHLAQQPQFSAEKKELGQLAEQAPKGWKTFVLKGSPGLSPVHQDVFLRQMAAALSHGEELPPTDTVPFVTFFNWHVRLSPALQERLATYLRTHLDNAIQLFLVSDYPQANQAYKQILLNGINGLHASLKTLHQKFDATVPVIVDTSARVQQLQMEQSQLLGPLVEMMKGKTKGERLDQYKRALLAAFKPYQELAIDNFAAADQAAPDIWDMFVHPACAEKHLRPEEMDAAQRETPPRNPAVDLLPLLAQTDHRRTVLLGDPGMGKSTLIQALIAHLASGRALVGAPTLTGLLPVPLILRDLVPLLPQDQVENWSWDALLDTFLTHYKRDEAALRLCDAFAFKDHLAEFRQHLHTDPKVFFLIDGLDEIGNLEKRTKVVQCIQDGIRAVSNEARWLITSRVIGYDNAPGDYVNASGEPEIVRINPPEVVDEGRLNKLVMDSENLLSAWRHLAIHGDERWEGISSRWVDFKRGDRREEKTAVEVVYLIRIAQRLYLAPFDDQRQDTFTQQWFRRRHSIDHSCELMREVRSHHHDGVRIISRVPNLLCLMNILKRSGKPLPDGRAALYDEIVKAYLGGIDAAYRLRPVLGNTCPFDATQRRFLLSLLGAHMQQQRLVGDGGSQAGATSESEGTILISKREIVAVLAPVIERLVAAGRAQHNHTARELLDELLNHIANRSGLLIPRSSDEHGETLFSFTHLSFLEFFAAEWLGMEFDRQRNRIVRRAEAAGDGIKLTDADLDREFPPSGSVQHYRDDFEHLPSQPAWHEPLIFLLESRKADVTTLFRWLFPALHSANQELETAPEKPKAPLLPLSAVDLFVKLVTDPEIPVLPETRSIWWQRLWNAYLTWPHRPRDHREDRRWPIAPLLLKRRTLRIEALQALNDAAAQVNARFLYLTGCDDISHQEFAQLTSLRRLRVLDLTDCTGLKMLPDMSEMKELKSLFLGRCTGFRSVEALQSLEQLIQLEKLWLYDCSGLNALPNFSADSALKTLDLRRCTGLRGPLALSGLNSLGKLEALDLTGCSGLEFLPNFHMMQSIKRLHLSGCVSLRCHQALAAISSLILLQELHLDNCGWLDRLPALDDHSHLRMLDLRGCKHFMDFKDLRRRVTKKCVIIGPDGRHL